MYIYIYWLEVEAHR